MGKQETIKQQQHHQLQSNQPQQRQQIQPKKKIIKKIVPKLFPRNMDDIDEELRNWKPTKLSEAKAKKNNIIQQTSKLNVAQSFLSSIPQPTVTTQNQKQINFYSTAKRKPQIDLSKPTEQQLKWDILDQTFLNRNFKQPVQNSLVIEKEFNEQQQQQQQAEPQIIILPNQKNKPNIPMKQVSISKTIEKAWNNSDSIDSKYHYFKQAAGMYMDITNKGTKQIYKHLKQTVQRQQQLNKRELDKKKIRNRYGW